MTSTKKEAALADARLDAFGDGINYEGFARHFSQRYPSYPVNADVVRGAHWEIRLTYPDISSEELLKKLGSAMIDECRANRSPKRGSVNEIGTSRFNVYEERAQEGSLPDIIDASLQPDDALAYQQETQANLELFDAHSEELIIMRKLLNGEVQGATLAQLSKGMKKRLVTCREMYEKELDTFSKLKELS